MATECPTQTGPSTAVVLVEDGWDRWADFADQAFKDAQSYVAELGDFTAQPVTVTVDFDIPDDLGAPFQKPTAPEDPQLELESVDGPGTLDIPDVTTPDFGDAPTDDLTKPSLNIPAAPDALSASAPSSAPSIADVTIPAAPDVTLPTVPTLEDIDLPTVPTITLPTFSAELPDDSGLVAPGDAFSFSEDDYSSTQLTALQSKISEMLSGSVGIPAAIWDQIWDRARTNEQKTAQAAINAAAEEWAARGFSLPPGALDARIREAQQNVQNAANQLNREIAIQQAQMEVENLRIAVAQGIALESRLIQLHEGQAQRALAAAQFAFEATVNVFNAKVGLFNAQLQSYSTQAQVYRERVQAELANIEIYRAQLEGQRIIGELNQQEVEIYNARIRALNTQVELHRAQVASVQAQVDIDKTRIDSFRALVEAYGEQVRAKTAEFQAYGEQVRGELAKADLFRAETDAFSSRVEAYRTRTQALNEQARLEVETNDLRLREFAARVEKYRADLQAEVNRVSSGVQIYNGKAQVYSAELGAENARVASDTRQFQLALEKGRAEAELSLKQGEINIAQVQRLLDLERRSKEVVASVQSQLAAAAMSAVNLGATISSSDSVSKSCSTSYNHNFQDS